MWRQPVLHPMSSQYGSGSAIFTDGGTARPLVPGTIARDHLREDSAFYTGIGANGKWVATLPPAALTAYQGASSADRMIAMLRRGQDRYKVYCTPCHGQLGNGEGMIAHRGFELRRPVGNYHTERLRKMPLGHFYDVITNGYGAMYSYASRIEPQDRWAVVAYIRALQLSQNADQSDVDQNAYQQQQQAEAAAKAHEGQSAEGGHE
jgi:mono/diheme cytochrome c family protein